MIQIGSFLKVVDNSGAREVKCIGVLTRVKQRYSFIGDIITVSIRKLRTRRRSFSKVKKGEVVKALIIRSKYSSFIKNRYLSFFDNAVVLLTNQRKLIGTRIFGSLPKYLRYTKHLRLTFLCAGLIN